ncbi:hypothetical protein BSU04_37990 [Caballeronia sordidicola]|uniref:Uncharacterized protein n=1 Tax=Caballeronia sordidicola TaxID=196367 RepID=A0A226WQS2_CABSO|nr:hypothetical protein BSU04_37990 [Caballeronia sordidicola]
MRAGAIVDRDHIEPVIAFALKLYRQRKVLQVARRLSGTIEGR